MKPLALGLTALLALSLLTGSANAQRPERVDRPPRGERGPGDRGPGREGPPRPFPMHPLVQALDTDGDGEISASEIENASAALKKIDKNQDGRLTREELRPARPQGGPGRGPGGGPGGGRFGGPPPREGGDQPGPGPGFATRILENDKDGDGKVSKKEMPERMARMFDRLDANSDGFVDKAEAEKMAERLRDRARDRRPVREGTRDNNRPRRPESDQ